MDYNELQKLIKASKIVFRSRGSEKKAVSKEKSTIKFAFSSVVSSKIIRKGEKLSIKNLCLKRPGNGDFDVKNLKFLYGKTAKREIAQNHQIKKMDLI